jgi:parallel beta-helix repeat protein
MNNTIFTKIMAFFIIFVLIFFFRLPGVNSINISDEKSNKILYVGGSGEENFTLIQDAVDNTTDGDTVFVYPGIYVENIVIDTSISLIGKSKFNTIIDANHREDAIKILSENTLISQFTLLNATGTALFDEFRAAINVTKPNNEIKGNIIKDNNVGVFTLRSKDNTIMDNQFFDCGILISPYTVSEVNIPLEKDYFIQNIENNTVNSKKIYYLKNQNDFSIPSDAGQVITYNCSNIKIENLQFSKCDFGLFLTYTDNCVIKNSTFIDDADIWIIKSSKNYFYNNTMLKNFHGITLDYYSCENIIESNNLSENRLIGVMLEKGSNSNLITKNNMINNNDSMPNAYMIQCFRNKWKQNYYDDWIGLNRPILRFFPKLIVGKPFKNDLHLQINIDWKPARTPYDI